MTTTPKTFPKVGTTHQIDAYAKRTLDCLSPTSWESGKSSGNDYGIDYDVQVSISAQIQHKFSVQLKGTTNLKLVENDTFVTFALDVSAVEYYRNMIEPVMLVVVDVDFSKKPWDSKAYYGWIHDLVDDGRDLTGQSTITVRIPAVNLLHDALDVEPVLTAIREQQRQHDRFQKGFEELYPTDSPDSIRARLSQTMTAVVKRGRIFVETIATLADPWPDAPRDSYIGTVKAGFTELYAGKHDLAVFLAEEATKNYQPANLLEEAERFLLLARVASYQGRTADECAFLIQARTLANDSPRYLVPWVEADMRLRYESDEQADLTPLLRMLTDDKPEVRAMRARLYALNKQYAEAQVILDTFAPNEQLLQRIMLAYIQHDYVGAMKLAEDGLKNITISPRERAAILCFAADAIFKLALHVDDVENAVLPPTGPADTDIELLRKSLQFVQDAVPILRSLGWPPVSDIAAGIADNVAPLINQTTEVLPWIKEAFEVRPHSYQVQHAMIKIAWHCNEAPLALKAISCMPHSPETVFLKMLTLQQVPDYPGCVDLFDQHGHEWVSGSDNDRAPLLLSMTATSAHRSFRMGVEAECLRRLDEIPEWREEAMLTRYYIAKDGQPLMQTQALACLIADYSALPDPSPRIILPVMMELDLSDDKQAKMCIDMAARLTTGALLPLQGVTRVAQAHANLHDWKGMLELMEYALSRFPRHIRLQAIKAHALDMLGHNTEALALLESILDNSSNDDLAIGTYVSIRIRMGQVDTAIRQVSRLITITDDHDKKLTRMAMLFGLQMAEQERLQDAVFTVKRFGDLVDQQDHDEEVRYLLMMIQVTQAGATLHEQHAADYNRRFEAFFQRFPNSRGLRRGQVTDDLSPDELYESLKALAGITEESLQRDKKVMNLLTRQQAPLMYALRCQALTYAPRGDLPYLWQITKMGDKSDPAARLTLEVKGEPRAAFGRDGPQPLIDLVSLFVLHDLDLIDELFQYFRCGVVITQATLWRLQTYTLGGMIGSLAQPTCKAMLNKLSKHTSAIESPANRISDDQVNNFRHHLDAMRDMTRTYKYVLYSDDAFFRYYTRGDNAAIKTMGTLDFLKECWNSEIIDARRWAKAMGTLCQWNVAFVPPLEALQASIPDAVGSSSMVNGRMATIIDDTLCKEMLFRIFGPESSYAEVLERGASMLVALARNNRNEDMSVAAIIGCWYQKINLRTDDSVPVKGLSGFAHLANLANAAVWRLEEKEIEVVERIMRVIHLLIPIAYPSRDDDQIEQSAIGMIGELSWHWGIRNHKLQHAEKFRRWIQSSSRSDTQIDMWFTDGYNTAMHQNMKNLIDKK